MLLSTNWVWTLKPGFDQPDVLIAGAEQVLDTSLMRTLAFIDGVLDTSGLDCWRQDKTLKRERTGPSTPRFRGKRKII